jgi:hypothetical protein
MTPDEMVSAALWPLVAGMTVAFFLSILGGLVFWALDLVRGLWSGRA